MDKAPHSRNYQGRARPAQQPTLLLSRWQGDIRVPACPYSMLTVSHPNPCLRSNTAASWWTLAPQNVTQKAGRPATSTSPTVSVAFDRRGPGPLSSWRRRAGGDRSRSHPQQRRQVAVTCAMSQCPVWAGALSCCHPVSSTLSQDTCVPAPGWTWCWDRGVPEAMGRGEGTGQQGKGGPCRKRWRPAGPRVVRGVLPYPHGRYGLGKAPGQLEPGVLGFRGAPSTNKDSHA